MENQKKRVCLKNWILDEENTFKQFNKDLQYLVKVKGYTRFVLLKICNIIIKRLCEEFTYKDGTYCFSDNTMILPNDLVDDIKYNLTIDNFGNYLVYKPQVKNDWCFTKYLILCIEKIFHNESCISLKIENFVECEKDCKGADCFLENNEIGNWNFKFIQRNGGSYL